MSPRRELGLFALALAAIVSGMLHESLIGGKVLSPGDVVFATESFGSAGYEPRNRLLMDPVLQFEPWLEFTRAELRAGRLPLWNPLAGCGAPHLANGQSAVFDPFRLIAYVGTLPGSIAWMAAARLWVAGLGTFLLARAWRYGVAGRWLSGVSYPLCGFVMAWLLYPIGAVAVWMPWLFLTSDRAIDGRRFGVSGLAIVVGCAMLGGNVQAGAHLLLASGLYMLWRIIVRRVGQTAGGGATHATGQAARWTLGVTLGIALAAIAIVPLAAYLSRSPVWSDRESERPPILSIATPRVLDAATTAFPYLFGSQRRGHPNLARALGVHNLNEAAGGFVGLATLIWLAPAAWSARRKHPRVGFLAAIAIIGAMGAFDVVPVANLLRATPIVNVADNRRLTLWVAFSLVMLGGIGIDATSRTIGSRGWTIWTRSWVVISVGFVVAACGVIAIGPRLREKSLAHYAVAAKETPGADPAIYKERAERQARSATTFLPRYYLLAAGHLLALAALAEAMRRVIPVQFNTYGVLKHDLRGVASVQLALIAISLADLITFGLGLNPSIPRTENRPESELIAYLRREIPPPSRIIAVGSELPPNTLMRYGLADARNYDSIELSRSLAYFDHLFDPEPNRPARTSRRTIQWEGAGRSIEALKLAGVGAIVGSTPPPVGIFSCVDRVGRVWVARLEPIAIANNRPSPREIWVDLRGDPRQVGWVAETFDPGWTAEVDGQPVATHPHLDTFLAADVPAGSHRLVFRYEPIEVRIGAWISLVSLGLIGLVASVERTSRKNVGAVLEPRFTPG